MDPSPPRPSCATSTRKASPRDRRREAARAGSLPHGTGAGAIALFDREFVKPGSLSKDLSRWLHDAFSERQDADYGTDFGRTTEEASESLQHAQQFVAAVRDLLRREGHLPAT